MANVNNMQHTTDGGFSVYDMLRRNGKQSGVCEDSPANISHLVTLLCQHKPSNMRNIVHGRHELNWTDTHTHTTYGRFSVSGELLAQNSKQILSTRLKMFGLRSKVTVRQDLTQQQ